MTDQSEPDVDSNKEEVDEDSPSDSNQVSAKEVRGKKRKANRDRASDRSTKQREKSRRTTNDTDDNACSDDSDGADGRNPTPPVATSSATAAAAGSGEVEKPSVAEVCSTYGLTDVQLGYSTSDGDVIPSYKVFMSKYRAQLQAANPKVAQPKLMMLVAAKWREYQAAVPNESHDEQESSESSSAAAPAVTADPVRRRTSRPSRSRSSPEESAPAEQAADQVSDEDFDLESKAPSANRSRQRKSQSSSRKTGGSAAAGESRVPTLKIRLSGRHGGTGGGKKNRAPKKTGSDAEDDDEGDIFQESEQVEDESAAAAAAEKSRLRNKGRQNKGRDSDAEFEEMLRDCEDDDSDETSSSNASKRRNNANAGRKVAKAKMKIGTKGKRKSKKKKDFASEETWHQEFCEVCQQGGEIILCDTCPRAYHLCCLTPELDVAPEGTWSCPHCEKHGPEDQHTDELDEHNEHCYVCKEGGELLCCHNCPSGYHLKCCDPPLDAAPEFEWTCARCACDPLPGKVEKILSWRWKENNNTSANDDNTSKSGALGTNEENSSGAKKDSAAEENDPNKLITEVSNNDKKSRIEREFLVKFKDQSYWHCDWITELQLDVHHAMTYKSYLRRNDMDEPPMFDEDGEMPINPKSRLKRTKRQQHDPLNLYERFFKFGIRPDWLEIHHVINKRIGPDGRRSEYLIKWKDLSYSECTWEDETMDIPGYANHIADYDDLRYVRGCDGADSGSSKSSSSKNRSRRPAKSASKKSDVKDGRKRRYNVPPEKGITDLDEPYSDQPRGWLSEGLSLHDYQLTGISWARNSWNHATDIILADEMGLGKTIQTITFLYSLYMEGHCPGPFLIAVPLSTLVNWEREFELWAPEFYVVSYVGDKESRIVIREHEMSFEEGAVRRGDKASRVKTNNVKFHAVLTSYELVSIDSACLGSINWEVLVVDEAHRLKNASSKFFRFLSAYNIKYKMLLTGTPLQNNLEELFYLLNFLTPSKFNNLETFQSNFTDIAKEEQVRLLHDMLGPHMLRRMKADVLKNMPSKSEFIVRTNLSAMQRKLYKSILTRNFESLKSKSGQQMSLLNIMMELKKTANHPYLLSVASEEAPVLPSGAYEVNAMRKACGKLVLLSKMLTTLKEQGHRVLIFSQMTKMLDLLEDFLDGEGYKFERIDGGITGSLRQDAIDRFNAPGAEQFCFLLSTRAGGLGINLYTADTVVIYDSDWNPHNDIQALSRAHRIGQKNKVMIYRFVTRNTVEERVTQVAKKKMMLTHLVVQPGMGGKNNLSKKEIDDILKFGTEELFGEEDSDSADGGAEKSNKNDIVYDDEAIQKLLDRSQEGIEEKESWANEYLSSFKVATYQTKKAGEEADGQAGEDDQQVEVLKEESESTEPAYWERLLRHHFEQHQEDVARSMGKGKRVRKQVNYGDDAVGASGESRRNADDSNWQDCNGSDFNSDGSSVSDEDGNDDDFEDGAEGESGSGGRGLRARGGRSSNASVGGKQSAEKDTPMPPLLARVGGNIEVLGFNARQRKSFLNSVMRYGMPPREGYCNQWLVRDLRGKTERIFRGYASLFMRHLCEPGNDNQETFADGVPREGLSRQHVLTRIGIVSLIRKKVHEFESVNGKFSAPHLSQQIIDRILAAHPSSTATTTTATAATPANANNSPSLKTQSETPQNTDVKSATPAPDDSTVSSAETPAASDSDVAKDGDDASSACSEATTGTTNNEEVDSSSAVDVADKKKDTNSDDPAKSDDGPVDSESKVDAEKVTEEGCCDKDNKKLKDEEARQPDVKKEEESTTVTAEADEAADKVPSSATSTASVDEVKPVVDVPVPSSVGAVKVVQKFMFNIADGGFTELHTLWANEEKVATKGREYEIWHRRHDYWLLAGVVTHGYGRWGDIQNDPRFIVINEPFKMDVGKGNFAEIKNKFLARRFKLLEQALVVEEQLRRAACLNLTTSTDSHSQSAAALNSHFSEVQSIAHGHSHVATQALAGNRQANAVLHKVLNQLEDLLADMKSDVSRLPASLARIPPVAQRLQMSERSILSRLVTQPVNSNNKGGTASGADGGPGNSSTSQQPQPMAAPDSQFPINYDPSGQLQSAFGTNFALFRPQFSVPSATSSLTDAVVSAAAATNASSVAAVSTPTASAVAASAGQSK